MENLENLTNVKTIVGDVAVSGLFNGLLAEAAMAVYLILAGLLRLDEAKFNQRSDFVTIIGQNPFIIRQ